MDGSPVRGQKSGIIQLNQVEDPQTFQAEIVRVIRADLPQTEIFFGLLEPVSNTLQLPAWVRSHLERHPGLALKLEQGAMVGISHADDSLMLRPASAARASVVLIPIINNGTLLGAIGLVSSLDGRHLSAEEVEGVRQLSYDAAPILARLLQIDALTRKNEELVHNAERVARTEANLAKTIEDKNIRDALLKMGWHLQSNVAHDLRTPLAAIRGYARMILDGRSGEINDTQREYLRILTENTNRLINIVSWMSHIAELTAQHFSLTTFDLRHVWAEALTASRQRLAAKSLTLTERIPDESFEIIADRESLSYVFNELITAAVKVAGEGSAITAEFSRGREREIMVKITASGSSIAPEVLSKIFERSFNSSVKPGMTTSDDAGINLSGTYDAVGMHGGRMFVNSTSAQVSTFLFTLPAVVVGGEDKSHEQAVNFGRR
jgi:signal transduction histidine kinase